MTSINCIIIKDWLDKVDKNSDWNKCELEQPLIEAVRELLEKETPMDLYYEGDGYDDGELVCDMAICQKCGREFEVYFDEHYNYCPSCGQKLKWREENDE